MKIAIGICILFALGAIVGYFRRQRLKSRSRSTRSAVDEYRVAENSWYVIGYLLLIIGIGVLLLLR